MQKIQHYLNELNPNFIITVWRDDHDYCVRTSLGAETRFDSRADALAYAESMANYKPGDDSTTVDSGPLTLTAPKKGKLLGE